MVCLAAVGTMGLTHWSQGKMAQHFSDDISKFISLNKNVWISIKNSLGWIDNKSALVPVMAWCQTGDKPLPTSVLTKFHDTMWHHQTSMS